MTLTCTVEDWYDALPELKTHLYDHWEELALDKDKVPLDPCWEIYDAIYQKGELLIIVLRDRGKMVGYYVGFIKPSLHYRTCLTCTTDIWRVSDEVRGRFGGMRLMRTLLKELKRRGVDRFFGGSKLHKDNGRLFEAFGMKPVETYYSIYLGD